MNGKVQEQPLITPTPADIVRFGGATPSNTNPLPIRLTDGTSYYDARQIRALVNTDVVKAQLQDNAGAAITLGQKVRDSSLPVVLASNQYRTPYSYAAIESYFSCVFEWTNTGTTEKNLIQLLNPNGSGKNLVVKRMIMTCYDTVSSFLYFRVYANPTITGAGTALAATNRRIKSSPVASVATPFRDPTTSALGTFLQSGSTPGGTPSASLIMPFEGGLVIEPNNRILVTAISDGTNRDTALSIEWGEE